MASLEEEVPLQSKPTTRTSEAATTTPQDEVKQVLRIMPLTKDTTCGLAFIRGSIFQRYANQSSFGVVFGLVGCVLAMTRSYFNGTISTMEKRFKIPTQNMGTIMVGTNIASLIVPAILGYYAGKGHRPRWMSIGVLALVVFCFLTVLPHLLYGPGTDALVLTAEHGGVADANATAEMLAAERAKTLCHTRDNAAVCELGEGNLAPQVILFIGQFVSGIGSALIHTLGVTYMDDNTQKSKTPAMLSMSFFFMMMGPSIGYALASYCLQLYVSPELNPVIDNIDPRWLGAWWLGWFVLGAMLVVVGVFLGMFPKALPQAVARRKVEEARLKLMTPQEEEAPIEQETPASLRDMLKTFKSLATNKILMWNNFSSVFYFFGYTPYWTFMAKYIEIQYRQSASASSMATGTVAFVFTAIGILLSGLIISKYKPSARYLAAWNAIAGFLTVGGIIAYSFIGCPGNETSFVVNIPDSGTTTCNSACQCDYVPYSPVCGQNGLTYISACHAGCRKEHIDLEGKKTYHECACIVSNETSHDFTTPSESFHTETSFKETLPGGTAIPGACPVDCYHQFSFFLIVMCTLKFLGGAGKTSNLIVAMRCVPEKDKTASMGFGMMMMSLLTYAPAPVFFGWLLDGMCLVWGKTCTNQGNCWLYDPKALRYTTNMVAGALILVGTLFDCGVWYYVKDLQIFDEEVKETEATRDNSKQQELERFPTLKSI